MDRRAIPEDQDFTWQMPLEMAQKFDDLEAFDTAGMDLEIEPPEGQSAYDRETFPIESLV